MEIGLHIADFTFPDGPAGLRDDLTRIVTTAEEAGFAKVSVMDHLWQIGVLGPPEHEMLEAYTTLGYLAARTSNGRTGLLGDGGGLPGARDAGQAGQHPGCAVRRPGLAGHRRRLERGRRRAASACRSRRPPSGSSGSRRRCRSACRCGATTTARTTASTTSWSARSTRRSRCTKPHPPILIGGGGEKKTLRLVAKYAQACNLFPIAGARAQARCAARALRAGGPGLRRHREDGDDGARPGRERREGRRDPADSCRGWPELGISHVHGIVPGVWKLDPLTVLGREVIPAIADW